MELAEEGWCACVVEGSRWLSYHHPSGLVICILLSTNNSGTGTCYISLIQAYVLDRINNRLALRYTGLEFRFIGD